jgi:hypothetical protein
LWVHATDILFAAGNAVDNVHKVIHGGGQDIILTKIANPEISTTQRGGGYWCR